MATTSLPANVTIVDLPTGTTVAGTELFEAVQTVSGVQSSVSLTPSNIASYVGSVFTTVMPKQTANFVYAGPTSGGTAVPSFRALVNADLPTQSGLSVFGVAGTATAIGTALIGVQDQVLRVDQTGTTLGFGAVNLATSVAVTGVLQAANVTAANLASANVVGGVQGQLSTALVTGVFGLLNGGVGTAALTGAVLGNGSSPLSAVAFTTAGLPFVSAGSTSAPTWTAIATSAVSGIFGLASGGIGTTTLAVDGVVIGNDGNALQVVAATTAGYVLTSQGSASVPAWSTPAIQVARLSANMAFTSQTALQNLTGLTVNLATGGTYSFMAKVLLASGGTSGGCRAAIGGTITTTNILYDGYIVDTNAIKGFAQGSTLGATVANSTTTIDTPSIKIDGTVTVNNGGTLLVQFAQQTTNATAAIAARGSFLMVQLNP